MGKLRFEIGKSIQDVSRLKDDWGGLTSPGIFANDYDWLVSWLEAGSRDLEYFLVQVFDGRELIGIIPLCSTTYFLKGLVPVKQMRFLGDPDADWHDFMLNASGREYIGEVWEFINNLPCNELLLHNLHSDSVLLKYLESHKDELGNTEIKEQTRCFYIDTTVAWDDYYNTIAHKQFVRQDVRRLHRRLEEQGIALKLVNSNFSDIDADLDNIRRMHQSSQVRQGRDSLFNESSQQDFLKSCIRQYSQQDKMRLHYLTFNDVPVAYALGYYFDRVFYYWNIGFDTEHQKLSPSKLLLYYLLKQSFDDETVEFNFMRGEADYKKKWANSWRPNYQVRSLASRGFAGMINRFRNIRS